MKLNYNNIYISLFNIIYIIDQEKKKSIQYLVHKNLVNFIKD